jgi:hypothetical protein
LPVDTVRRASRRSGRSTHHPEETHVPARRPRSLSLALALALAAAPLGAQTANSGAALAAPAAPPTEVPAVAAPAAPMAVAAPAALTAPARATAELGQEQAALQARARNGFSQSQVLMIVGGAALLTGLIIGDDVGNVLAVGGAGVGLYGLYRYLQGR